MCRGPREWCRLYSGECPVWGDQAIGLHVLDRAGPDPHPWPSSSCLADEHEEAEGHGLPSRHSPGRLTPPHPRLPPTACNCSGHSEQCEFDPELFRSTGHGGRCLRCRDHTAGPHCQRCQEDFYRWSPAAPCRACDCHPAGEGAPQPWPPGSPRSPCCPAPFLPQAPCVSSAMTRAPAFARPL